MTTIRIDVHNHICDDLHRQIRELYVENEKLRHQLVKRKSVEQLNRHDIAEIASDCGANLLDGWDIDMLRKFAMRIAVLCCEEEKA